MEDFVYVKAVSGRLVPRYSTLQSSATTYIGAVRDGKKIVWTEGAVVRIPRAEWTRYVKEYQRVLIEGSLEKATVAEFVAWEEARDKADAPKPVEEPAPEATPEAPQASASAGDKKKSKKSSKADEGEKE